MQTSTIQKLLFYSIISILLISHFAKLVEAQDAQRSVEFSADIGSLWFLNSSQEEFIKFHSRQFDNIIEDWKSEFNLGLLSPAEWRIFQNG